MRSLVVKKRGNKWCVMHCHGKKAGTPIKCYSGKGAKGKANKMHRAIMASKSGGKKKIRKKWK